MHSMQIMTWLILAAVATWPMLRVRTRSTRVNLLTIPSLNRQYSCPKFQLKSIIRVCQMPSTWQQISSSSRFCRSNNHRPSFRASLKFSVAIQDSQSLRWARTSFPKHLLIHWIYKEWPRSKLWPDISSSLPVRSQANWRDTSPSMWWTLTQVWRHANWLKPNLRRPKMISSRFSAKPRAHSPNSKTKIRPRYWRSWLRIQSRSRRVSSPASRSTLSNFWLPTSLT